MFTKEQIITILHDQENQSEVEKFTSYCVRISTEKERDGTLKNAFMQKKTAEDLCNLFKRVKNEWLVFDGVHITLQSTGVSYDYVAYKNKMYLAYPETKFDVSLVYKGDEVKFWKVDGNIVYNHDIKNPFEKKDADIIGAYAIVRNKRGEYLTTLSLGDIAKHRKVAKTDYIWKQWFSEMCLKTIVKKACKLHFGDIFTEIEEMDNENYDLDKIKEEDREEIKSKLVEKYA